MENLSWRIEKIIISENFFIMDKPWYEAVNVDEYDSPALFIYPDRIKYNIRTLLEKGKAVDFRPHVKTNKIAEVCELMLDAGIKKFKAATIAEAEMLAMIKRPMYCLLIRSLFQKLKGQSGSFKNIPTHGFPAWWIMRTGQKQFQIYLPTQI
jgi:hypothetical protein